MTIQARVSPKQFIAITHPTLGRFDLEPGKVYAVVIDEVSRQLISNGRLDVVAVDVAGDDAVDPDTATKLLDELLALVPAPPSTDAPHDAQG